MTLVGVGERVGRYQPVEQKEQIGVERERDRMWEVLDPLVLREVRPAREPFGERLGGGNEPVRILKEHLVGRGAPQNIAEPLKRADPAVPVEFGLVGTRRRRLFCGVGRSRRAPAGRRQEYAQDEGRPVLRAGEPFRAFGTVHRQRQRGERPRDEQVEALSQQGCVSVPNFPRRPLAAPHEQRGGRAGVKERGGRGVLGVFYALPFGFHGPIVRLLRGGGFRGGSESDSFLIAGRDGAAGGVQNVRQRVDDEGPDGLDGGKADGPRQERRFQFGEPKMHQRAWQQHREYQETEMYQEKTSFLFFECVRD